jgi:hypothetical protein
MVAFFPFFIKKREKRLYWEKLLSLTLKDEGTPPLK